MEEEYLTLPPGISGNEIGTLSICFQHCSIPKSFARIKFWGGDSYSCDLHPSQSVNFLLVGETSSIVKYMKDASPLHIQIFSSNDSTLIGNVFIIDLSPPMQSLDCKRSSRGVISLHQEVIGDASFELHFQMMPSQEQLKACGHDEPTDPNISQLINQANDSVCQDSEIFGSTAQEKYSLVSELLDICSDDITIPTVDTSLVAATGIDPYELWISNMADGVLSSPRASIGNQSFSDKQRKESRKESAALESSPHPISLFLSNVASAASAVKNAQHRSCTEFQSETQGEHRPTAMHPKLEPVQPPPIWIGVEVYRISNLQINSSTGGSSHFLELNLKCTQPLLSLCDLGRTNIVSGDEAICHSSDNIKSVELTNECCNLVSVTTQLLWQAGIKSMNGDLHFTLQLRYCYNDTKMSIGHVSIPFECKGRFESLDTLGLLPAFDANGWFDILDPKCSSSVGKIQLSLASGTLKQIRRLPKANESATAIQHCWRRKRNRIRFGHKDAEVQPGLDSTQDDCNDDEMTLNSLPPPPPSNSDDSSTKQMHTESSPDSLFEEWSQQSFLHVDTNKAEVLQVNAHAASGEEQEIKPSSDFESTSNKQSNVHDNTNSGVTERHSCVNPNPTKIELETKSELQGRKQEHESLPLLSSHIQYSAHDHDNSGPNLSESNAQRRQPIDPPEERDQQPKMKRKIDTDSSSVPDAKRHCTDKAETESQTHSPASLPSEAKDMSIEEDDNSEEGCRSLQSVMESLAGVEARLKGDSDSLSSSANEHRHRNEESVSLDDAAAALGTVSGLTEEVVTSKQQTPKKTTEQIGNDDNFVVNTCEKGTSPLLLTTQFKDAATSPCEAEKDANGDAEEVRCSKDAAENDSEDTSTNKEKNEGRSTFREGWRLKDLSRSHFPTLNDSFDRRERYGSLFKSRSPCSKSGASLRLNRLLSPNEGVLRVDGARRDSNSNSYKKYLPERRKPLDSIVPSINSTSVGLDRIEHIFSAKKKKED